VPRFHVDLPLAPGLETALPDTAARHVRVLRLPPGAPIVLFNGDGRDFDCEITHMSRSDVQVRVGESQAVERELAVRVTLAVGMPANERMDWLVEKATELGVSRIQPLMCERSVLRLSNDRAIRKVEHWQAVSASACEQCGRAVLPRILPVLEFSEWVVSMRARSAPGFVLSLREPSKPFAQALPLSVKPEGDLLFLSGPEGGLAPAEDEAARTIGLQGVSLGPRVLRAETAPVAALAAIALHLG